MLVNCTVYEIMTSKHLPLLPQLTTLHRFSTTSRMPLQDESPARSYSSMLHHFQRSRVSSGLHHRYLGQLPFGVGFLFRLQQPQDTYINME